MSAFRAQVLVYNYYILVIFLLSSNIIACSIFGRLHTLGRLASNLQFIYIKARIRISSLYTRESLMGLHRALKDDISEPIPMSKDYKAQNKPPIEVEVPRLENKELPSRIQPTEPATGESLQPHLSPASTNRTPHRVCPRCTLHKPESKCRLHLQEASAKLCLHHHVSQTATVLKSACEVTHHGDYKLYKMAWNQSHASGDRTASPTVFEQQREELVREIAVVSVLGLGLGFGEKANTSRAWNRYFRI